MSKKKSRSRFKAEAISLKKSRHVAKRRSNRLGFFSSGGVTRVSDIIAFQRS